MAEGGLGIGNVVMKFSGCELVILGITPSWSGSTGKESSEAIDNVSGKVKDFKFFYRRDEQS